MKVLRGLLCVLTVAALAFAGWFYIGGTLDAQVSCVTANAAQYPDAFETIRETIQSGGAHKVYIDDGLSNAEDYTLMDISVQLQNRGVFPAEYVTVEPCDESGDVALYSLSGEGTDISPGGIETVNFKLVTRAGGGRRSATIRYYIYGMARTVTVEYEANTAGQ